MSVYEDRPLTLQVGRNVRLYRQRRRWTLDQLAERLQPYGVGVSASMLAAWEANKRASISVDRLYALADVFRVAVEEMVEPERCPACNDRPPSVGVCPTCKARVARPGRVPVAALRVGA